MIDAELTPAQRNEYGVELTSEVKTKIMSEDAADLYDIEDAADLYDIDIEERKTEHCNDEISSACLGCQSNGPIRLIDPDGESSSGSYVGHRWIR